MAEFRLAAARRFLSLLIEKSAGGTSRSEEESKAAARQLAEGGWEILTLALKLEAPFRREVEELIAQRRALKSAFVLFKDGLLAEPTDRPQSLWGRSALLRSDRCAISGWWLER